MIHYQIAVQESTAKYLEDPIQYIIQSVHGPLLYKILDKESTVSETRGIHDNLENPQT